MIKYSICTTVYNGAPRLRASLESILKYINPDKSGIIVVDSKSTNGMQEILQKCSKKYSNFKMIEWRMLFIEYSKNRNTYIPFRRINI